METKELPPSAEPAPVAAATPVPAPAPPSAPPRRLWPAVGLRFHLAVILTLGAVALFTFANSFSADFALDNKLIILEDPRLREANWDSVQLIFTQDYWWPKAVSGLYRPLTTLSYWLNYTVFGHANSAAGYHWLNLFLHWGNSVLAYFVVLILMGNIWPAFFAAALFVVHPVTTESVTNIIGRADLFAAAAVLGGFLFYAKSGVTPGWRKALWLCGLGVVTALGVFAKESAVVVIGVLVIYDLVYRIEPRRENWLANIAVNFWSFFWKGYIAVIPAFLGMWHVRSEVFARLRPPELPWVDNPLLMPGADFWTQRFTALKVIGKYLWLLVWPQHLSPDYSYNQIPLVNWHFGSWEMWKAASALAAIVALLLIALKHCRRNKPVAFAILFFFVTLAPTANLVAIIGSIMAERFLYLPQLAYAVLVVVVVYQLCRQLVMRLDISAWSVPIWLQVMARSALALIVVAYGARAFARNFDWQDDVTLWSSAVRVAPNSFKTHKSLAYALYEADPEGKDIDRIIEEGEKAKAVTAKTQVVLLHLGAYYRIKGDQLAQRAPDGALVPTAQSREWYAKSVAVLREAAPLDREFNEDNFQKELRRGRAPEQILDVGNHEIYWNLGLSLMRLSQYDQAAEAYEYMRHLAPTNPDAYLSLASTYLSRGRLEESVITLLQTLLLDNTRQETLLLLVDLYRQLDTENCAVVFTAGEPKLNVDCRLVATHMCRAYLGLVEVFMRAKQSGLAQQTRQSAIAAYRCDPTPFDRVLAGESVRVSPPQ